MGATYQQRIAQQIEQYRQVANIHDLPAIFHYWSNTYLLPRMRSVCEAESVSAFFAQALLRGAPPEGEARFLSVGAGDCSIEIEVTRELRARRPELRFVIECAEVSPILVARGRAAAGAAGLGPYVEPREVDLNGWSPDRTYHGVMANHSLHHLVELERIFLGVRRCLAPGATFSVNDMIGRNGHMRWPEVLEYVEQVWSFLPREKKYNHQQRTFDDRFQNRDYSHEGFEGIRAQDILPLLVREFGFLQFLPFGGVIDPFIDRGFGHNYDPARKADTELIDGLEELTSNLIDTGRTKPTQMLATLVAEPAPTACWRSWTPAFCVRDPARGPT